MALCKVRRNTNRVQKTGEAMLPLRCYILSLCRQHYVCLFFYLIYLYSISLRSGQILLSSRRQLLKVNGQERHGLIQYWTYRNKGLCLSLRTNIESNLLAYLCNDARVHFGTLGSFSGWEVSRVLSWSLTSKMHL